MSPESLDRIESALSFSGGTHSVGDVVSMIVHGQAQLWEAEDATIVTELHYYPRQIVLHFWLTGGEMSAVLELQETCVEWARSLGITRATLAGRKGWIRALKGTWEPGLVLMERAI